MCRYIKYIKELAHFIDFVKLVNPMKMYKSFSSENKLKLKFFLFFNVKKMLNFIY